MMRPRAWAPRTLELWGGLEPAVNRVADTYLRRLERSGHLARAGDAERFAGLGVRALRDPVLWESNTSARGPHVGRTSH